MGDDLTDMGISATAAAAMGREQVVLAHHPEHPLAGNTATTFRPEAEPRPCGVPRPPRGMPSPGSAAMAMPSGASSRQGLRSPALCWWALMLPGFHGVERGTGKTPGRTGPAGGLEDPCRVRWRHSSAATSAVFKGNGRLPVLASEHASTPRFMAMSSAITGQNRWNVGLRSAKASIGADRLRHALCSSRKISTPNCRDKSSTGSPRKSRRATSRLRVSTAGQVPAKPAGETWPGENVDEPELALEFSTASH